MFEGIIWDLIWSRRGFGFQSFDGGGYFFDSECGSGWLRLEVIKEV